jgi:hypothetical protein
MTIDEFKPSATNRCGEDVPGKVFARVRLDEAQKSTANADLTCSPLAPTVDRASNNDCRRARAAGAHLGGPHQHQAMWLSRGRDRIALLIQGGGALGAYQAEVYERWPRPICPRLDGRHARLDPLECIKRELYEIEVTIADLKETGMLQQLTRGRPDLLAIKTKWLEPVLRTGEDPHENETLNSGSDGNASHRQPDRQPRVFLS